MNSLNSERPSSEWPQDMSASPDRPGVQEIDSAFVLDGCLPPRGDFRVISNELLALTTSYTLTDLVANKATTQNLVREIIQELALVGGLSPLRINDCRIKHRNIVGNISTEAGVKFFKLTECDAGLNEIMRGEPFKQYANAVCSENIVSIGNFALLTQPFVPELYSGQGVLMQVIAEWESCPNTNAQSQLAQGFQEILDFVKDLHVKTMRYSAGSANNDVFFAERLKPGGRIESHYQKATFSINSINLTWDELKRCQFEIDGRRYVYSLEQVLSKAAVALSPDSIRVRSISHGDGVDSNICSNLLTRRPGQEHEFGFFDLETAGFNDTLCEMASLLVHLTIMSDYTLPKYQPDLPIHRGLLGGLYNESKELKYGQDEQSLRDGNVIVLNGYLPFGLRQFRKDLALKVINDLIQPVLNAAQSKIGAHFLEYSQNHFRAALVMRLIGVHDLTKYDSHDQAKMLALAVKLGSPRENTNQLDVLNEFLESL